MPHDLADPRRDLLRRLHLVGGHVDDARHDVLAAQQVEQFERHARVGAFERDLIDAALGEERERALVLAPLRAERLLPVHVRLDAVAVADVHRGRAREAFGRTVQRPDPPRGHVVHVDVERRLVQLQHVEAGGDELARLLVDDTRERQRQPRAVVIMLVGQRVDDRHRPGDRELQASGRVGARPAHLVHVNGRAARDGASDGRHLRLVPIGADADRHALAEVDPLQALEEAVDEVLARLLAVGDDVDAGRLLVGEREPHGVALRFLQGLTRHAPRRPQRLRLCQP